MCLCLKLGSAEPSPPVHPSITTPSVQEVILSRLDFDSQAEWEAYSASLKPQVAGKGANPRKAQVKWASLHARAWTRVHGELARVCWLRCRDPPTPWTRGLADGQC